MMKTIHKIQYFLFALVLIGMFANFAQNEYSYYLLNYPYLFIGILFFMELFILVKEFRSNQTYGYYSFVESLALGLFFCGSFFKAMHWQGAAALLIAGGAILLMLYLGFGIKKLSYYYSNKSSSSLAIFCLAIVTCLALSAYLLRVQLWGLEKFLTITAGIVSIAFFLPVIININLKKDGDIIPLRERMKKMKSKLVLSYTFFSFWAVYSMAVSFNIAPGLYSLANPPALEKMYREQNPLAETYLRNYQNFLNNRNASMAIQNEIPETKAQR